MVYLMDGRISMMGRPSDVLPHVHTEELVQGDSPAEVDTEQHHSPNNLKKNEINVSACDELSLSLSSLQYLLTTQLLLKPTIIWIAPLVAE